MNKRMLSVGVCVLALFPFSSKAQSEKERQQISSVANKLAKLAQCDARYEELTLTALGLVVSAAIVEQYINRGQEALLEQRMTSLNWALEAAEDFGAVTRRLHENEVKVAQLNAKLNKTTKESLRAQIIEDLKLVHEDSRILAIDSPRKLQRLRDVVSRQYFYLGQFKVSSVNQKTFSFEMPKILQELEEAETSLLKKIRSRQGAGLAGIVGITAVAIYALYEDLSTDLDLAGGLVYKGVALRHASRDQLMEVATEALLIDTFPDVDDALDTLLRRCKRR